ncbi:unnamed protein product, partial [Musa acuminata subsp. malaccensis]
TSTRVLDWPRRSSTFALSPPRIARLILLLDRSWLNRFGNVFLCCLFFLSRTRFDAPFRGLSVVGIVSALQDPAVDRRNTF